MRHAFNSPHNDISYEVARDQSMVHNTDLTLDQSDVLNADLTFDKSQLVNMSNIDTNISNIDMDLSNFDAHVSNVDLSNIDVSKFDTNISNVDDLEMDFQNFQNDIVEFDENQGGSFENISEKKMSDNSNLERLKKILLDPISEHSKVSRKRRLIVDEVKVISSEDIQKEIQNFKNSYSSNHAYFNPGKENIPPIDIPTFDDVSLMTIRNKSNISRPLALKCSNLLSKTTSYFDFDVTETSNINTTTNDQSENVDSTNLNNVDDSTNLNIVDDFTNLNDDFDDVNTPTLTFNDTNNENFDDQQPDLNIHDFTSNIQNDFESNINDEIESFNSQLRNDYNLKKYDHDDTVWSKATSNVAKNIQRLMKTKSLDQSQDLNVTFQDYVNTSVETPSKKEVAKNFYSLLILQKENVFKLKQEKPFGEIVVSM